MSEVRLDQVFGWERDCGGKMDYDGEVVTVDSRFYPAGGSHMEILGDGSVRTGEDRPWIPPSASANVRVMGCLVARQEFAAESAEEVRDAVEAWVAQQVERINAAMIAAFPPPFPQASQTPHAPT